MNNDYEQTAKAKSRISSSKMEPIHLDKPHTAPRSNSNWPDRLQYLRKNQKKSDGTFSPFSIPVPAFLVGTRIVWLIFAIILFTAVAIILLTIRPSSIDNILLYQSYLPFIIVFFAASAMLGKAMFLYTRRAIFFGLFFTILLLLRLQSVELDLATIVSPLLFLVGVELIISLVFRK